MNKYIFLGFILLLIVTIQSANFVYAQTNLTNLFSEDPQFQLCTEYETLGTVCNTNIINVVHETNNTLFVSVANPEFMGPALDVIYGEGFKIEGIIPDITQTDNFNSWIYFTK